MGSSSLKDKTSKGLFWGGMSNLVQQVLNAAFGIYLMRTLSPDDYGLVGMLALFSMLALMLQDSGFFVALVNRREIREEDYNSVFWCNLLIALLCYAVLFFCAPLIARYFHQPELVAVARWTFLGFVFSGFGTAQKALLTKKLQIKELAIVNIVAVVVSGAVGVTLAWKGFAYWTLVIQALILSALTNFGYWLFSGWHPKFRFDFRPAREMLRFGVKLLATNVVSVINSNFITVVLGRYYPAGRVGYYTQANKWSSMGNSVLSGMINSVVQPVMVAVVDDDTRQLRVLRKMMRFAAFIAFPAMLGLAFIAPEFLELVGGEKWIDSIPLLQILCVGGAFIPIINVCSGLIISRGKSSAFMWSNIALMVATLVTIYLAYPYGITWMVICLTVINVLWLLVWWLLARREVRYSFMALLADLLPFLGVTLVSIAAAWFLTRGIDSMAWRMVAKIAVTAVIYIVFMRLTASVTFKECVEYFLQRIKK